MCKKQSILICLEVKACSKSPQSEFWKDWSGMGKRLKATSTLQTLKKRLFFVFFQELYRKDCNLAAQLLQCSKNYDRAHKLSEVMWPSLLNIQGYKYCMESRLFCTYKFQNLFALKAFPAHPPLSHRRPCAPAGDLCSRGSCWQNHSPWWNLKVLSSPKPLLSSRTGLPWLPVKQRF